MLFLKVKSKSFIYHSIKHRFCMSILHDNSHYLPLSWMVFHVYSVSSNQQYNNAKYVENGTNMWKLKISFNFSINRLRIEHSMEINRLKFVQRKKKTWWRILHIYSSHPYVCIINKIKHRKVSFCWVTDLS